MTDNLKLLQKLLEAKVEFIVIGGVAAAFHGSSVTTYDLDLCVPFTEHNLEPLLACLVGLNARFRAHPDKPPLQRDPGTYLAFRHLLLETDLGAVDLLRQVTGLGDYEQLLPGTQVIDLQGHSCRIIDLESLITAKRAVGRDKDLRILPELEMLRKLETS